MVTVWFFPLGLGLEILLTSAFLAIVMILWRDGHAKFTDLCNRERTRIELRLDKAKNRINRHGAGRKRRKS